MDKEKVVKKLRTLIKEFVAEKGKFSLVMLIPSEPNVIDSKVTLLISAPWLDKESPKHAIDLIVKSLRKHLDNVELPYITRVTIVNSSDNFVKAINAAFNVTEAKVDITNCNVFGVQIDKAIILESHRVKGSKEQPSVPASASK